MNKKTHFKSKGVLLAAVLLLSMAFFLSAAEAAAPRFIQTNLVSDITGLAKFTDPNLVNPWGLSHSSTSPLWMSNNGAGVATLFRTAGSGSIPGLVVTVPPSPPPSTPTGQVFNGTSNFELSLGIRALFIFATENGTISGWNPTANPTNAILKVDNSGSGAVYKGLAIGNNSSGDFLYAANFAAGSIDVFDNGFNPAILPGAFTDPALPANYAPFNIQNIGGSLFVTYALQNGDPGGIVSVFDTAGNFLRRLSTGGALDSPWGLAIAPASFGQFAGDLLVGNHGDGKINVFDPINGGASLGSLLDSNGNPIIIDGLWGLIVGNGGDGGDTNKLYFTAGLNDGAHGLLGSLAPLPGSLVLLGTGLFSILVLATVETE